MYAVCDPNTHELIRTATTGRMITLYDERTLSGVAGSREKLLALGVLPITDPGKPDPALYRVTGQRVVIDWPNAAFAYDAEPIPVAEIRANAIAAIKTTADALLTPTDWLVIRSSETGAPIPAATVAYRGAVRAASNDAEAAILAAGDDGPAILAVIPEWPETATSEIAE